MSWSQQRITKKLLPASAFGGLRPNRPFAQEGGEDPVARLRKTEGFQRMCWGPVQQPLNVSRKLKLGLVDNGKTLFFKGSPQPRRPPKWRPPAALEMRPFSGRLGGGIQGGRRMSPGKRLIHRLTRSVAGSGRLAAASVPTGPRTRRWRKLGNWVTKRGGFQRMCWGRFSNR